MTTRCFTLINPSVTLPEIDLTLWHYELPNGELVMTPAQKNGWRIISVTPTNESYMTFKVIAARQATNGTAQVQHVEKLTRDDLRKLDLVQRWVGV